MCCTQLCRPSSRRFIPLSSQPPKCLFTPITTQVRELQKQPLKFRFAYATGPSYRCGGFRNGCSNETSSFPASAPQNWTTIGVPFLILKQSSLELFPPLKKGRFRVGCGSRICDAPMGILRSITGQIVCQFSGGYRSCPPMGLKKGRTVFALPNGEPPDRCRYGGLAVAGHISVNLSKLSGASNVAMVGKDKWNHFWHRLERYRVF